MSFHPFWMIAFLVLTSVTFSLFGFILGIWSKNFEQLQIIPMLVVTPLTFLGGAFYSIDMLPPTWRAVAYADPVVYLIKRLPLELLRHRRCARGHQSGRHARVLLRLPRDRELDFQDGIRLKS